VMETDPAFGNQSPNETRRGVERVRGLIHGQQLLK